MRVKEDGLTYDKSRNKTNSVTNLFTQIKLVYDKSSNKQIQLQNDISIWVGCRLM
jgi:hypothetical protein